MVMGTYSVDLWDHEGETWSNQLAAEFLSGRAEGLSAGELARAIRVLRDAGWSSISMYVQRTEDVFHQPQCVK